MQSYSLSIAQAKELLRIPELWRRLNLPGSPANLCHSPFREDNHPSFSIFKDGKMWKDLAREDLKGDAIHFLEMHLFGTVGRNLKEAAKKFLELAQGTTSSIQPVASFNETFSSAAVVQKAEVTLESATKKAQQKIEQVLGNELFEVEDFTRRSISPLAVNGCDDSVYFLSALFHPEEYVNIITDYHEDYGKDGSLKIRPVGSGITRKVDDWIFEIQKEGLPYSPAGGWIRVNPVAIRGSGSNGAYKDIDVTAYRYFLVENDLLPIQLQAHLLAILPLPITAIIHSGGKSLHALIKVNSRNAKAYQEQVTRILNILKPYGFDPNNKNPSRMSRLPGVVRKIGGGPDPRQRLLWLNPKAEELKSIIEG